MNIAIIAPNDLYREGLKTALSQILGFNVCVESRCWGDTIAKEAGRILDVILLSSSVGESDPGGCVKRIRFLSPDAKILMLLEHPEDCWHVQALGFGADDVLPQHADKHLLEQRIRTLCSSRQTDVQSGR